MGKLLLLLDTMYYYDREVLKGIKSKIDELQLKVTIHTESIENIHDIQSQDWDYVIADYDKGDKFNVIPNLKSRILLYSSHTISSPPPGISTLVHDNEKFACLALGQFIQNDLSNVAFYMDLSESNLPWAQERRHYFVEHAKKSDLNYCDVSQALMGAQFPLGVYCASDRGARKLASICRDAGVSVPEQVSIVGTDYDDVERSISPLPLSSINVDPYKFGRRCVRTLIKMERFKRVVHEKYQPIQLVNEESTYKENAHDDIVNNALYFLHNNYHLNIKVHQVLDYCKVSRKTLDNRFVACKNVTAHQYLSDLRVYKSKKLLRNSNDSIESIALQCGYPNQSYLYQVYKKQFNYTPLDYRKGIT